VSAVLTYYLIFILFTSDHYNPYQTEQIAHIMTHAPTYANTHTHRHHAETNMNITVINLEKANYDNSWIMQTN